MTRTAKTRSVPRWARARRAAFIVLGTGTMFAVSCSNDTVRAVIDGIDAATSSLDSSISNQNQTFGEWLLGNLVD